MTPRLRPCGIPECRICRWNDEEYQDSGHVVEDDDTLAELLIGAAAIVVLFVVFFVILPTAFA